MNLETIENEALRLSLGERAKLAQKLLISLDALSDEELHQSWLLEADRRARELDSGDATPVSAAEVRKKARALLR